MWENDYEGVENWENFEKVRELPTSVEVEGAVPVN